MANPNMINNLMKSQQWEVDGVPIENIVGFRGSNSYTLHIDKHLATLEQIEQIKWTHPAIVRLDTARVADVLPEGYSFDLIGIEYHSCSGRYTVEVRTNRQFYGDVTGYQAEVEDLQGQVAQQTATVADLTAQLAEADDLAAALYEQIEAAGGEVTEE